MHFVTTRRRVLITRGHYTWVGASGSNAWYGVLLASEEDVLGIFCNLRWSNSVYSVLGCVLSLQEAAVKVSLTFAVLDHVAGCCVLGCVVSLQRSSRESFSDLCCPWPCCWLLCSRLCAFTAKKQP